MVWNILNFFLEFFRKKNIFWIFLKCFEIRKKIYFLTFLIFALDSTHCAQQGSFVCTVSELWGLESLLKSGPSFFMGNFVYYHNILCTWGNRGVYKVIVVKSSCLVHLQVYVING
jgi:hypothetical protein